MNRLNTLRTLMKEHECNAYLISDSDAHYTFYSLSREDRRINWITECQAQCGLALVTLNDIALFQVPSNYFLLAKNEINENNWLIVDDLVQWLYEHELKIDRICYDPRLTPFFVVQSFEKLKSKGYSLYPMSTTNLIDAITINEITFKEHTLTPIWSLDQTAFPGKTSEEKIFELRQNYLINDNNQYTLITTAMDEIAWLLNLRANDMECNPFFYSFMIISTDQLILFTDNPYENLHYDIRPYNDFFSFLSIFQNQNIWIDERTSMSVILNLLYPPKKIVRSPIQQMKEIKNSIELNGFKQCHYRDCAAVCETFDWLETSIKNKLKINEYDVMKYLENCQKQKDYYIGISFDTISANGINTSLVEYAPSIHSQYTINEDDIYYLDAGANYYDGTTDMTRTLHFGNPTAKQIQCYTLLLRAILSIEMNLFELNEKINGERIYKMLQEYLKDLDSSIKHISFGHGVSHGQGVIEGGISISDKYSLANQIDIKPGMVITLEPGIYYEGEWGIRIENVYSIEQNQSNQIYFNPLTLIPYEKKLIDFNYLTEQELIWIKNYHQRCLDNVNGGKWMKHQIENFNLSEV
ncbi:unnamed protein product [Adineta steineri]|uniref:Xaa-Pro aminopeptidase n=1 Tax=Adineta steineri TaxID=433720 RepID=A0A814TB87_9BILA|nr:unnamed protein product [Adineta steineri]CAF1210537.1 unnamed protein product [Adineta steineri]